jgi:hypothetical protein
MSFVEMFFNKIISLLTFTLLLSCSSSAQQFLFKVLVSSGKVEYRMPSTDTWSKVKTGDNLNDNSQLKLDKDSYAALMYNDGRTLEMMNEGIFEVKDLERTIQASKMTVTQKFANFVADEIIMDKSKGKHMKEFAAVVRVKPLYIESAFPSFTSVMESDINFSWYEFPGTKSYVFSILNLENTPIFMDLVEDTIYSVDAEELKLNKGTPYKWFVTDAENPNITSDTNSIIIVSDTDRDLIQDTLRVLNEEIESNKTPLNYLSMGFFYERNNLNLEALSLFNKVISIAPESEEYKLLFAQFLINNKLYTRVSELLKEEDIVNEN